MWLIYTLFRLEFRNESHLLNFFHSSSIKIETEIWRRRKRNTNEINCLRHQRYYSIKWETNAKSLVRPPILDANFFYCLRCAPINYYYFDGSVFHQFSFHSIFFVSSSLFNVSTVQNEALNFSILYNWQKIAHWAVKKWAKIDRKRQQLWLEWFCVWKKNAN